ncbi:MAG: hydrogenase 3 maturation endopeptidase HyCI [Candidatus Omnitrophota bacterium]|nr:hydrogenase 3 maturation endopeptidase HyCI [Candidatus Omnitrophota bacterium]
MKTLIQDLENKLEGSKRIGILGVGSRLRRDDAAGMLVVEKLTKLEELDTEPVFKIFFGETAPENLTGQIKKFKPTHLVIVDSVEAHKKPGSIILVDPDNTGGITFSTHSLPPKVMADYLVSSLKCKIIILGIQPKDLKFGEEVSPQVEDAVQRVVSAIKSLAKIK